MNSGHARVNEFKALYNALPVANDFQ